MIVIFFSLYFCLDRSPCLSKRRKIDEIAQRRRTNKNYYEIDRLFLEEFVVPPLNVLDWSRSCYFVVRGDVERFVGVL